MNFVVFMSIGVGVIAFGYLFGEYLWDAGWISTVPLFIMFVGLSIIPFGANPLRQYIQSIRVANLKKQELDEVLKLYNIEYAIDITVKKDFHGNQDISSVIHFQRSGKSDFLKQV
ncbi:hypothetical protein V6R21_07860 [Limibacter armeniacum]|uniref:hypothetical protein n=1 Tax=Limibacter armeniacum TaxID=466084 RepID=UPI002FE55937